MIIHIVDAMGWIGSLTLISAYVLVSNNRLPANSILYQWLNVIGSFFLVTNTIFYGAYPSTLTNLVWVVIGFYFLQKEKGCVSLLRVVQQKRHYRRNDPDKF